MYATDSLVMRFPDGEGMPTLIWCFDLLQCGACGRMHFLFVNRHGMTRCSGCDTQGRMGEVPNG